MNRLKEIGIGFRGDGAATGVCISFRLLVKLSELREGEERSGVKRERMKVHGVSASVAGSRHRVWEMNINRSIPGAKKKAEPGLYAWFKLREKLREFGALRKREEKREWRSANGVQPNADGVPLRMRDDCLRAVRRLLVKLRG